MESFKIEKNIEMPTWFRNGSGYRGMYPFEEMEVGDSFLIPTSPNKLEKSRLSVANAVLGYRKRWNKGFKGATRTVTGGVRFWCIKKEETDGD